MANKKKKPPLLPVYLVLGEDELKRRAVLKRLKARIADLGDLSFNIDEFNAGKVRAEEIIAACNTLPFASERRLVVVHSVQALNRADAELLVSYIESPSPTTTLALIADSISKKSKLYKAVSQYDSKAVIDCLPQKKYELIKTLRSLAIGYGISLTEGASRALVELVGENTVHLDNELQKLALAHRGNDPVSEREVRHLVSRSADAKPWEFLDAFSERDIATTIKLYGNMGSSSPHALLAMCVARIRELICARSLEERGLASTLARELGQPSWKVKNHMRWAQGFEKAELRRALVDACDAEKKMKSGSDPQTVFVDWVLSTLKA